MLVNKLMWAIGQVINWEKSQAQSKWKVRVEKSSQGPGSFNNGQRKKDGNNDDYQKWNMMGEGE